MEHRFICADITPDHVRLEGHGRTLILRSDFGAAWEINFEKDKMYRVSIQEFISGGEGVESGGC